MLVLWLHQRNARSQVSNLQEVSPSHSDCKRWACQASSSLQSQAKGNPSGQASKGRIQKPFARYAFSPGDNTSHDNIVDIL